jgi:enoyl-CoA hydratase
MNNAARPPCRGKAAMTGKWIGVTDDQAVRRIELDRPDKANALTAAMMAAIARAVREAVAADAELLVISGKGRRGFCAGADIKEFAQGEDYLKAQENALCELIHAFADSPLPVFVFAHGRTLGAGGILASLADVVLAADNLLLGFPEIRFNMYPVIVHAALMQKVSAPFASQLCTTGRLLNAAEAQATGLVSEVLPTPDFDAEAENRLRFFSERRAALTMAKRAARATLPVEPLRQRLALLAPMMMENYRRPAVQEMIAGHLIRRKPR